MKETTPQQDGRDFEKRFAAIFGVEPTRGSGNQWWAKLDIGTAHLLISCKHTEAASFRVSRELMWEVMRECVGEQEPVMAIDVNGEVLVVQRAGDWLAARTGEAEMIVTPSRAEAKRQSAKIPKLLQEVDGDGQATSSS